MSFKAIGHRVQEARAAAGAHLGNQALRSGVHGFDIVAVKLDRFDAEGRGARGHAIAGRHRTGRRGGGDAVVLAHEKHRQAVNLGPIEALEEWPAIGGAVSEKTGDHVWQLADLQRMCGTGGDRHTCGHHAVGTQHSHREVGNVHRAALALVVTGRPAE